MVAKYSLHEHDSPFHIKLDTMDNGHVGPSDPLKLDFYRSTTDKIHQTNRAHNALTQKGMHGQPEGSHKKKREKSGQADRLG